MNREASNVVGMRLERGDLFVRIVVEDAQLEVVRARDEPVLARDEAAAAHGDLRDLERLDERARVVVVDVNVAVVEPDEEPWLGGVEVDRLDAVRAVELFALGTGSGAWAGQRGWRLTDTSNNIGFRRWIYGLSAVCGVPLVVPIEHIRERKHNVAAISAPLFLPRSPRLLHPRSRPLHPHQCSVHFTPRFSNRVSRNTLRFLTRACLTTVISRWFLQCSTGVCTNLPRLLKNRYRPLSTHIDL